MAYWGKRIRRFRKGAGERAKESKQVDGEVISLDMSEESTENNRHNYNLQSTNIDLVLEIVDNSSYTRYKKSTIHTWLQKNNDIKKEDV